MPLNFIPVSVSLRLAKTLLKIFLRKKSFFFLNLHMLPDTQEPKVFYKNLIFFKTDCCNTNFEENTEHLNLENFTKN